MTDHGDDRLSDHALAVRYQIANLRDDDDYWRGRLTELDKQVCERFGVPDTDGLADAVTGHHMTAEEAVEWAACDFEDWRAWLTGEMTWDRWTELQAAERRGRDDEREKILTYLEAIDHRGGDVRDLHRAISRGEHRAGHR